MQVQLEKLPGNDTDTFVRATGGAAAFDLTAALTRPCKYVNGAERGWFFPWKMSRVVAQPGETVHDFIKKTPAEKTMLVRQGGKLQPNYLKLKIQPGETVLVPLGIATAFDPKFVALLFSRASSATKQFHLANCVGVIDSDYRDEWFAAITNDSNKEFIVSHGDRLVQTLFVELPEIEVSLVQAGKLPKADRAGGFGSTDGKPTPPPPPTPPAAPVVPVAIEESMPEDEPTHEELSEPEYENPAAMTPGDTDEAPVVGSPDPDAEAGAEPTLYPIFLMCNGVKIGPIAKVSDANLEAIGFDEEGRDAAIKSLAAQIATALAAKAGKSSSMLVTELVDRMFGSEKSEDETGATA